MIIADDAEHGATSIVPVPRYLQAAAHAVHLVTVAGAVRGAILNPGFWRHDSLVLRPAAAAGVIVTLGVTCAPARSMKPAKIVASSFT